MSLAHVPMLGIVALASCALSACLPASPPATSSAAQGKPCREAVFGAAASFALDPAALGLPGALVQLREKLATSAYQYFRALGPQFALRTCAAFRELRWHLPVVAIHADAHVEQFVVTPTSAGLEDFDQSGYGPAVVDLVRYAASLHLACREVAWPCDANRAVAAYFRAYRESLDRAPQRTLPAIVERLRATTPTSTDAWLTWADSLMLPLTAAQQAHVRRGWLEFRRLQKDLRPERPDRYYEIVRMGRLQMGVGSALERKLLLRIRGETDAADDDLVVEVRSVTPPSGNECAWRPAHGGSLQPLTFMAILGPRMPDTFGIVKLFDDAAAPEFWVQGWERGYHELAISDVANETELVELAQDAAQQLAGHFWSRFPEQLRAVQRHAQLEAFDLVAPRALSLARDFAAETVFAWARFREALGPARGSEAKRALQ